MKTKILAMAVIEKDNGILMRKKPYGSKPYKETWYLFGVEINEGQKAEEVLTDYLEKEIDIEVSVSRKLEPSSEIKEDRDDEIKEFHYINFVCKYISGTPIVPEGIEKVEWVPKDKLNEYDLVPPSKKLLEYLK